MFVVRKSVESESGAFFQVLVKVLVNGRDKELPVPDTKRMAAIEFLENGALE